MRIRSALPAIVVALAAVPAAAQSFGTAFVQALCMNGTYTLQPGEEPQYVALGDGRINFQDVGGNPTFYIFIRQGGVSSCEQQMLETVGGVPIRRCNAATVSKDGSQLTRTGWMLATCSTAN